MLSSRSDYSSAGVMGSSDLSHPPIPPSGEILCPVLFQLSHVLARLTTGITRPQPR